MTLSGGDPLDMGKQQTLDKHKMGLAGAISYVVGSMVGSGIIITAKDVLEYTGSIGSSLVVWAVAGLISALGGLAYTELGTSIRQSGADYAYMCYVNWRHMAFLCLWSNVWIYEPGELAILAKTFAVYIIEALPGCNNVSQVDLDQTKQSQINVVAILVIAFFGWLNMYRVDRVGSVLQIISTATKMLTLGVIIFTGLFYIAKGSTDHHFDEPFKGSTTSIGAIILAIYSCQWSYAGWETLNYGMEEVQDPKRNVPIAILTGTLLVTVTYLSANMAYIAVLGKAAIMKTDAVGQTFVETAFGSTAALAVPVTVALLLFGTLNPTIFCASRVYFTGAREGQLPTFIATLHHKHRTPRASLLVTTFLSIIMIQMSGGIGWLIGAITSVMFMQKALAVSALIWIKLKKLPVHAEAVRFPVALHILFLLICVCLVIIPIYQSPITSFIGITCVASGIPIYLFFVRVKDKPVTLQRWDKELTIFVQKLLLAELDVAPEKAATETYTTITDGSINVPKY